MSLRQPVQYPVRYYSYLDAGAPQLADIDGNIKTILKACLVTGIGAKVDAGWTALFEDDYRIVLRRPLRTGNPPDIKIENGVINGTARHRIVSQDAPTGLDDTNELAAVNLLARNNSHGIEWHLISTDFAFLLCYQMAESGYVGAAKNSVLYVGSVQKMQDSDSDIFIVNSDDKVSINGTGGTFLSNFLNSSGHDFTDMHTGIDYNKKSFVSLGQLSELHFNSDYTAQKVIVDDRSLLPFYCSACPQYSDLTTEQVSIEDRLMLRYVQQTYTATNGRPFYIPLDYWEL